jgi:hypothetical protein
MSVFNYGPPGLGHVGSYQVSGKPFVSGGIDVEAATMGGKGPLEISFPTVTRWITITNHDETTDGDVKVAFSLNGYNTNNFFTVSSDESDYGDTMTARLELKVNSIFLSGSSTNCDVIAGLTGILNSEISGNWTGSSGVG